jgi:hypothetical protein
MAQMNEIVSCGTGVLKRTCRKSWTIQGYGLVLLIFVSFFPRLFHLQEYLFFLLLIVALGAAWVDRTPLWVRTPIDLPLLSFLGWVLLSVPFATDPSYSLAEWRKLVAHVMVFYWALLVFRMHHNERLLPRVMGGVGLGSAALSVYALIQFVIRGGTWVDRYVRAGAPTSDYNWLSTYMVMAIPMLVAACAIVRWRWQRAAYAGATLLVVLAQAASYTRAGWLGFAAEGVALGLVSRRRWLTIAVVLCCLVGAAALIVLSQVGFQKETVNTDNLQFRMAIWEKTIEGIGDHPLVGIGYGNDTFLKRYGVHPVTGDPAGTHSLFLMVALGSGLPALGLLLWVIGKTLINLVRPGLCAPEDGGRAIMLGVAIMVVGFTVRNLFDYMFAGSIAFLFWILVAIGLAQVQRVSRSRDITTNL